MRNPLRRFYGRGDLHFVTFSCYRRRREDPRVTPDTWGTHPSLGSGWRGELAATTPSVISRGTRSSSQTDRAGPTRVDFTWGLWPGLLIENYGPNGPLTDWQRSCREIARVRKVIVKYRLSRCRSGCPDCWGRPQRIFALLLNARRVGGELDGHRGWKHPRRGGGLLPGDPFCWRPAFF